MVAMRLLLMAAAASAVFGQQFQPKPFVAPKSGKQVVPPQAWLNLVPPNSTGVCSIPLRNVLKAQPAQPQQPRFNMPVVPPKVSTAPMPNVKLPAPPCPE